MNEYLDFSIKLAEDAGDIAIKIFSRAFETEYKSEGGRLSPVTEADKACEAHIISSIKNKFPRHGIVSEEAGKIRGVDDYTWFIDPIDGTRNFSHKIPHFSISIALLHNNDVFCGTVYDPCLRELFYAQKGKGAFLNRKPVFVSNSTDMKHAAVSLDGSMSPEVRADIPKTLSKVIEKVETVRIFAGAALDLCYIACGRLDGAINRKCNAWDVAAAGLILAEAGGTIEDMAGKEHFPFMTRFVAGTPYVTKKLISILDE